MLEIIGSRTNKGTTAMISAIIKTYDFNLKYAAELVSDIKEEDMYRSLGPGLENHPAFTLGHLATGSALMAECLGRESYIPTVWTALFQRKGPGDPTLPLERTKDSPSKQELVKELSKQHEVVKEALLALPDEKLSESVDWRFSNHFGSLLDLTAFMCMTHEAMHLGQLAAWRRAAKLTSALARM
jgi:hypothetical protein